VLYFMLKLVNNKALMGRYTNSHWFNVVAWATTVIVIGLTVVMVWQQLHTVGAGGAAPASVGGS
jgi:Mn2+/Fe2+ NRAMP family transporter